MHPDKTSDKVALTIAGSDSGGGAGIQADLKTFEAYHVFGTCAITALTAQNSVGVQGVSGVDPAFVLAQVSSVLGDFEVAAMKTGMLFDAGIIQVVIDLVQANRIPLVVDPVMVSTSGHVLLEPSALSLMKEGLLPLAAVITPNIAEAEILTGMSIDSQEAMHVAAAQLSARYPQAWILLKGGHLEGAFAMDLLLRGDQHHWITAPRLDTQNTHGTGCTLSAAITAGIALGWEIPEAVKRAKLYVNGCLQKAWSGLGHGHGSLRHYSTAP